jgi:hypothetical protein
MEIAKQQPLLIPSQEKVFFPGKDILPIFLMDLSKRPVQAQSFEGTAFMVAPSLAVTCWHCVRNPVQHPMTYALARRADDGRFALHPVLDAQQASDGSDLATLRVLIQPTYRWVVRSENTLAGQDVFSYGYPYTESNAEDDGVVRHTLGPRVLKGYITRDFHYSFPYGDYPMGLAYELDMHSPRGMSGAPILEKGAKEVVGVMVGATTVETIEYFGRIDPVTGKKEPDEYRVVSFGVAHCATTLAGLSNAHTGGVPLVDYLDQVFDDQ